METEKFQKGRTCTLSAAIAAPSEQLLLVEQHWHCGW
jgi:hypothetical protein